MAVLLFFGASGTATAFTVFGTPDCGKWISQPTPARKGWLLGYLSGLNGGFVEVARLKGDPLSELQSAEQAFLWMDNYCRANPLQNVSDGAITLFIELIDKVRSKPGN